MRSARLRAKRSQPRARSEYFLSLDALDGKLLRGPLAYTRRNVRLCTHSGTFTPPDSAVAAAKVDPNANRAYLRVLCCRLAEACPAGMPVRRSRRARHARPESHASVWATPHADAPLLFLLNRARASHCQRALPLADMRCARSRCA